jgi:hypothetical protein
MKFSQKTIDSIKADLGAHPAVTAAGASFNWAGLISVIENIVNEILPLFTGATPAATTVPVAAPVAKP